MGYDFCNKMRTAVMVDVESGRRVGGGGVQVSVSEKKSYEYIYSSFGLDWGVVRLD